MKQQAVCELCMQAFEKRSANEKDCDSCTSFNRIEPQFCKRCGITFYERKSNDICKDCRAARIKQAQRKYAILNQKRSVI